MSLRGFVPPRLHEQVQDLALAVDGSPQPQAFAPNHDRHFVEVPLVAWPGTKLTEVASESWPELARPADLRVSEQLQRRVKGRELVLQRGKRQRTVHASAAK